VSDARALTEIELSTRREAFEDAEASLRLEGLEPGRDARYRAIKARLLDGTLTFDEAEAAVRAQYAPREAAVAKSA